MSEMPTPSGTYCKCQEFISYEYIVLSAIKLMGFTIFEKWGNLNFFKLFSNLVWKSLLNP